jgi:hypothetical protein
MKTFPLAAVIWLLGSALAGAQEPPTGPLNRGDVHFVVGWQNLHKPQEPEQSYGNWLNGIFFGGGGAGWYWTDNLKTQVDVGGGTRARQYRYSPIVVGGLTTGAGSSRLNVQQQSVAVAQQYQFFRNQWFHPHLGAGVEIARETTREEYDPIFFFDPITRVSRQTSPARIEGPDHRFVARPFVETGFKAYLTRRAFFTGDARLMFRTRVDEVLFRAGFGIDF